MTLNIAFAHLRIKELEGKILARRRLAEQAPERAWHLSYVEVYEAEMQQLQAILQRDDPTSLSQRNPNSDSRS